MQALRQPLSFAREVMYVAMIKRFILWNKKYIRNGRSEGHSLNKIYEIEGRGHTTGKTS